jgi:carboxyl-terminal processing protease
MGFLGFLVNGNYKYPTEAEKELEKTVQKAKEANNYDLLKNQFDIMSNKLKEQKKKDLAKHQKIIKETLEAEIISRYYFEKGKLQYKLTRDKDILEALKILEDQANYNKILNISSNK